MEKTYLHWNFPNWITVVLMAGIGMALYHGALRFAQNYTLSMGGDDAGA